MWVTTDYKGNKKVWYEEAETQKYINTLKKIKEILTAGLYVGMQNDILKIIKGALNE